MAYSGGEFCLSGHNVVNTNKQRSRNSVHSYVVVLVFKTLVIFPWIYYFLFHRVFNVFWYSHCIPRAVVTGKLFFNTGFPQVSAYCLLNCVIYLSLYWLDWSVFSGLTGKLAQLQSQDIPGFIIGIYSALQHPHLCRGVVSEGYFKWFPLQVKWLKGWKSLLWEDLVSPEISTTTIEIYLLIQVSNLNSCLYTPTIISNLYIRSRCRHSAKSPDSSRQLYQFIQEEPVLHRATTRRLQVAPPGHQFSSEDVCADSRSISPFVLVQRLSLWPRQSGSTTSLRRCPLGRRTTKSGDRSKRFIPRG